MLLLSASTKKRKHNWEITKRDLTKLTSPSVRTKNDWSRHASGQKIGYLNSRTLRSVRLCFFLPHGGGSQVAPGIYLRSPQGLKGPKGTLSSHNRNACMTMRPFAHRHRRNVFLGFAVPPSAASTQHILPRRASSRRRAPGVSPALLVSSAHEKTRHSPQGRVSRRGWRGCCR